VRFEVAGTALDDCGAVPLGADGAADCQAAFTATAAGRAVTATYSGDGDLVGSADSLTQHTDKAHTTTALTSSANPSVSGQAVTYTATVAVTAPGAAPTPGAVSFADADGTIPGCAGEAVDTSAHTATCTSTYASPAGSPHAVVARYAGNGELQPSASPEVSQVVQRAKTDTALTSSDDPSVVGQPVTLIARVTVRAPGGGSPGGTVAFQDGGTAIDGCGAAAVDASGKATCTTPFTTTAGSPRTLLAVYSGDSAFEGSTSDSLAQTVDKAATTISFTQQPVSSFPWRPLSITVKVSAEAPGSGTPTGNVWFVKYNVLGIITGTQVKPLVDGKASFTMLRLNKSYAVRYDGDSNYLGAQTTISPR
jgi:hypothetical protein